MKPTSLSVAELREILEQSRPIAVVDIRAADDREWTIPGSIQVDALDAVKSGRGDARLVAGLEHG